MTTHEKRILGYPCRVYSRPETVPDRGYISYRGFVVGFRKGPRVDSILLYDSAVGKVRRLPLDTYALEIGRKP